MGKRSNQWLGRFLNIQLFTGIFFFGTMNMLNVSFQVVSRWENGKGEPDTRLEAWVQNYMGEPTIGKKTHEKVFELLLRLKANYIWSAMHVNSFNLTPENGALADRMGIVVGTSHCDMLMRSNNREWKPWIKEKGYTDAVYDYSIEGKNREILREYWRESVMQNRDFEVCYTLGMRGIHDSGFETKNLAGKTKDEIRKAKIELLEKIISDQREILKKTLGHEAMMTSCILLRGSEHADVRAREYAGCFPLILS